MSWIMVETSEEGWSPPDDVSTPAMSNREGDDTVRHTRGLTIQAEIQSYVSYHHINTFYLYIIIIKNRI